MPEDEGQPDSRERMGGDTAHQQEGAGASPPEAGCRATPLRVGVEATDEVLALLSAAGMNALPDPDGEPPRTAIVEVDADGPEEAARKVRDVLGDVSVETD
jgi:hypothetical protein